MIYTQKIHTDLQINTLEDLAKLKPFLEDGTLKVNKSQIARELGKDRRTVDKYLKGYKKPTTRHKGSRTFYIMRLLWLHPKALPDSTSLQDAYYRLPDGIAQSYNCRYIFRWFLLLP